MAQLTLQAFSNPELLGQISEECLADFLRPHIGYLRDRGVPLDDQCRCEDLDILAGVLITPNEETPAELVDDIYFADELATDEGMDALNQAIDRLPSAERAELTLPGDVTPAEAAIWIRLKRPDLLERVHAERQIWARRSFEYFRSASGDWSFTSPSLVTIRTLEAVLDSHFDELKRGRNARVFVFERTDEVWVLIRHGRPFRRERALSGTLPSNVVYRPEYYDVLRYDPAQGQLAMHAETKKIGDLYRREVGLHLFGNPNCFPVGDRYTLEPLRAHAEAALVCSDVEEMEWVRLREVWIFLGGPEKRANIWRSPTDLLADLRQRNESFPRNAPIVRATFAVKFKASAKPRMVTLAPPKTARFVRDGDSAVVERWFVLRGFALRDWDQHDAALDETLEDA